MTHPNDDPTTDNDADHATSAFRADFLDELDTSTDVAAEPGVWDDGLVRECLL